MKKIVYRYQISKFKRFTNGLIFALIALIALSLCIVDITDHTVVNTEIIFPFSIAILSMAMGFVSMFRNCEVPKRKYHASK
jgi:hypothetical protein